METSELPRIENRSDAIDLLEQLIKIAEVSAEAAPPARETECCTVLSARQRDDAGGRRSVRARWRAHWRRHCGAAQRVESEATRSFVV